MRYLYLVLLFLFQSFICSTMIIFVIHGMYFTNHITESESLADFFYGLFDFELFNMNFLYLNIAYCIICIVTIFFMFKSSNKCNIKNGDIK